MTSDYEPNEDAADRRGKELEEIIGHVRYLRYKVDDITDRLKDSYELLREILDSVSKEDGATWYDHYGNEDEY